MIMINDTGSSTLAADLKGIGTNPEGGLFDMVLSSFNRLFNTPANTRAMKFFKLHRFNILSYSS